MDTIPPAQLLARMQVENPWWGEAHQTDDLYRNMHPRACIGAFAKLVEAEDVRRAVVLMGPRRVGKTVLLQHIIQKLLDKGIPARSVVYLSLDQPLYSNLSIEELVSLARRAAEQKNTAPAFLFLDEIQYLKDWERHLKVFVDAHPHIKCVVSGSAAAALRLKSIESGAGRFTDFFLPPLTFYEYLDLQNIYYLNIEEECRSGNLKDAVANELHQHFIRYIQMGGYPEIIFSETIRKDMSRYVRSDIINKVLLGDLPSLYGIQDIQELNFLFMTLAWNTAQEVSLGGLSQRSGISEPTLERYLEYLEAAFLIKRIYRIDYSAKRFRRANFFKVYLINPSIHCALFGPLNDEEPSGTLIETAVFAQWFHFKNQVFHYGRWPSGEMDIVSLDAHGSPSWCLKIRWLDKDAERRPKHGPLMAFLKKECAPAFKMLSKQGSLSSLLESHPDMKDCYFTVRAKSGTFDAEDRKMFYLPASVYSYIAGHHAAPNLQL